MFKSRRMGWEGHVACTVKGKGAYRFLVEKPKERGHLEDLHLDWSTIFKRISKKWNGGTDWIDLA
jgi:hypothetical protein